MTINKVDQIFFSLSFLIHFNESRLNYLYYKNIKIINTTIDVCLKTSIYNQLIYDHRERKVINQYGIIKLFRVQ
jgi:hypothetical protein